MKLKDANILLCICLFLFINVTGQQTHEPSNGNVKILSWNIQMLPDFYSPFFSYLRKKQSKRLPEIIEYLNRSGFDIVILQEVFDVQVKNKLAKRLSASYPHVQKPIKKGFGIKLSNGIMVLSKYPIHYVHHIQFRDSKGNDKMSQKGCVLLAIEVLNKKWLIAGTHLNSTSQEIRNLQYTQLQKEIISPYKIDSIPFILAGDLNTTKNTSSYLKMINEFNLNCSELKEKRPYTYDSQNSWNQPNYNVWIDYLLHNLDQQKVIDHYIIRPSMNYKDKLMDLADHYGIVLTVTID